MRLLWRYTQTLPGHTQVAETILFQDKNEWTSCWRCRKGVIATCRHRFLGKGRPFCKRSICKTCDPGDTCGMHSDLCNTCQRDANPLGYCKQCEEQVCEQCVSVDGLCGIGSPGQCRVGWHAEEPKSKRKSTKDADEQNEARDAEVDVGGNEGNEMKLKEVVRRNSCMCECVCISMHVYTIWWIFRFVYIVVCVYSERDDYVFP